MDHEKLYETCYMQVYSYVMTLSGSPTLSEEITQETFFRAMTASKRAEYRSHAGEVTWLCAIARNLWMDELRKRQRQGEMPEEIVSGDDPADSLARKETTYAIHVALHALSEPYKEVFQLRVFGELSFRQIGDLFGKTENWARVTFHRAKLMIQERLE